MKPKLNNTKYYVYDNTPYAYYNASKHVQRYLKINHGIDTDIKSYTVDTHLVCGTDCIRVDTGLPTSGGSYLGHTKEDKYQQEQLSWYSNVLLASLTDTKVEDWIYFVCNADEQVVICKVNRQAAIYDK